MGIQGVEALAGTPAYMSPEQFAGGELTPKSDLYSLGLVLYEIFTGKRPFDASSSEEMARLRDKSTPTAPSQFVKELDPLIERVILRCLERDPAKRPASALQVAAALPGGDPLAAALSAGETPSPEMVAASGATEGLRPAVAWIVLAGIFVLVTAGILFGAQAKLYRRVPLEKPPDELAGIAREILKNFGYTDPTVDTAMGFYEGKDFLRYITEHDTSKTRWDNLETGAFVFWYRGSPRPLVSTNNAKDSPMLSTVWTDDPPLDVSGMTLVELNPQGRLTKFVAVPPQVEKPNAANASTDRVPNWASLFSAAGLDLSKWSSTTPAWTPPNYSDARAAWTGSLAERPDTPMRIEAAAYGGKPIYFELIGPWTHPQRMQPHQPSTSEQISGIVGLVLMISTLVGGVLLARRNLRLGRSDRRGAAHIAGFVFAVWALAWSFGAHHVSSIDEFGQVLLFLVFGISLSAFLWVIYIALEPYVRRRWPGTLVSWSRLMAGGLRDPLVGRDILFGCLVGAFGIASVRFGWHVPGWLGHPPLQPYFGPTWQFLGARPVIADLSNNLIISIFGSFVVLFTLFLLRAFLRKEWLAAIVCIFLITFFRPPSADPWTAVTVVSILITTSLAVFLFLRFGLLAVMASYFFDDILGSFPLTTQMSAWYAGLSIAGILLMAAIAFYAFYTSLGGQPLFGGAVRRRSRKAVLGTALALLLAAGAAIGLGSHELADELHHSAATWDDPERGQHPNSQPVGWPHWREAAQHRRVRSWPHDQQSRIVGDQLSTRPGQDKGTGGKATSSPTALPGPTKSTPTTSPGASNHSLRPLADATEQLAYANAHPPADDTADVVATDVAPCPRPPTPTPTPSSPSATS